MGCEPWLSPGRDCARSAARHGVLLGVRVRQLRATGAPQSEKNRTLRGSAAYLPTSLVCPKIAHPALSHGVPQMRTRSERIACVPWLSPCRDCARSAARHGVLLGVRVRQLRATGAPQSEKNRTLRGSAAYLPTSLVCPKIAHPALSHGVPQVRTRSERIACVSWLSPCRDCARSAARHGFLWVSTSDSSAPQALRNRLKKIARSAALLHICRLRWCVRKSRILRSLCEGGTVSRWRKIAHPALALRGGEEWEIENGENTVRFDRFRGGGGRGGLWRWWRGCGGVQG